MKTFDDILGNMANETPIIRFVWLILYQAMADGAEIVTFKMRREGNGGLSDGQPELPRRDVFEVGYQGNYPYNVLCPPPVYLYWPTICRLCCLADVHYWSKGPVTGYFKIRFGAGTDQQIWPLRLQSNDLQSGLTITRISESELPAEDAFTEVTVPEPPPSERPPAMPTWQVRPVPPPDELSAWVWAASRCAFYSVGGAVAWALLAAGGLMGGATLPGLVGSTLGGLLLGVLISWRVRRSAPGFP
jgi:hypothetical protein